MPSCVTLHLSELAAKKNNYETYPSIRGAG